MEEDTLFSGESVNVEYNDTKYETKFDTNDTKHDTKPDTNDTKHGTKRDTNDTISESDARVLKLILQIRRLHRPS